MVNFSVRGDMTKPFPPQSSSEDSRWYACRTRARSEKKVERLLSVDAQGRARTEPFKTSADEGDEGDDEGRPPF